MRFVRFMVEGSFLLKVFLNDIGVSFLRFRGDFLRFRGDFRQRF